MKAGAKYLVNPAPFVAIVSNPKGRRAKSKRRNPIKAKRKAGVFVIRKAKRNPTEARAKEVITRGNRAVVINRQGDFFWADLYVNARNGIGDADITGIHWTGSTEAGARRWAEKQLSAKNPPMKTRRRRSKRRNPAKRRTRRSSSGRFVSKSSRNPSRRRKSRRKSVRSRNPMSKKTRRRGSRRRSRNPMARSGARRRSGRRSSRRMRNPLPVVRELFGPDMLSLGAGVVVGSVGTKMIMNRLIAGDPATGARSFSLPGVNYQVAPTEFYSRNAWILALYNLAIGGGAGWVLRNQSPRLARGIMIGAVAGTITDVLRNTGVLSAAGTFQMPQMMTARGTGRNYGPGVGYLPGTNTAFTGPAQRFLSANNVPRPRGMGARVGPGTMAAMQSNTEGSFRGAN